MEYIALMMFIMGALYVSQRYILRAFSGRWRRVGDSFGQGHIYEPRRTLNCKYDPYYTYNWYDADCYEKSNCGEPCYKRWDHTGAYTAPDFEDCKDCIQDCVDAAPRCWQAPK